jgi:hypothetical protein
MMTMAMMVDDCGMQQHVHSFFVLIMQVVHGLIGNKSIK